MPPTRRQKDQHLPPNVYIKGGAYYFVRRLMIDGKLRKKWFFLARDYITAMAKWAEATNSISTTSLKMSDIFDRYMVEIAPQKAKRTYQDNLYQIANLRTFFGDMYIDQIKPTDIYHYLDIRALKAKIRANREKSLLSHVFSMAIRWGLVTDNPCKNVKRLPEKPRDRYITDKEFLAVRGIASPLVRGMMDIAYLTGQRQGDLLKIKLADLQEEGIFFQVAKTGNKILIEWSTELREAIQSIKEIKHAIGSLYLFSNQRGQPYTSQGFKTFWLRTIYKALDLKVLKERFTFHDIRRKAATDLEKAAGREQARQLLGHSTQKMTGVYISGTSKVKPVK